jgi:hypothetical protein
MFQGPMPDLSYKPDREEHCSQEQELVHHRLQNPTYVLATAPPAYFHTVHQRKIDNLHATAVKKVHVLVYIKSNK